MAANRGLLIAILVALGLGLATYLLARFAIDLPDKEALSDGLVVGVICAFCGPRLA